MLHMEIEFKYDNNLHVTRTEQKIPKKKINES